MHYNLYIRVKFRAFFKDLFKFEKTESGVFPLPFPLPMSVPKTTVVSFDERGVKVRLEIGG